MRVLLPRRWRSPGLHASPMMEQLAKLRDKYDLHMTVERFVSDEYEADKKFIRQ